MANPCLSKKPFLLVMQQVPQVGKPFLPVPQPLLPVREPLLEGPG